MNENTEKMENQVNPKNQADNAENGTENKVAPKESFIDRRYAKYCERRNARLEKKRQKEEAKANKPKPTTAEKVGKAVGYSALGLTAIGLIVKAAVQIAAGMNADGNDTASQIQDQIEQTGWIEGDYTEVPEVPSEEEN